MNGKKALIMVVIAFAIPVVAAKLVLEMGWFNKGATNKGELLTQEVRTDWLEHDGKWRLVYTLPKTCEEQCESALFQLKQIPVAVGPGRDRVTSILLVSDAPSTNGSDSIVEQKIDTQQLQTMAALPHASEAIYLVDPLNNLILAYPIPVGKSEQITQSKGLLSDLRKLMKLSKVG